jgi:hypothetical protein
MSDSVRAATRCEILKCEKSGLLINEIMIPKLRKRVGAKRVLVEFLEGLQTPTVVILVD